MDKKAEEKVAVFDFGGGTFDISILEVGENVVEVLATGGNNHLGGDNVDEALMELLSSCSIRLVLTFLTTVAMQRLKEAAEKAKIELSSAQATDINLPFLTADATGPKHLNMNLTRAKFEQLIADLIEQTMKPCSQVLKDAGLSTSEIDEVIRRWINKNSFSSGKGEGILW